MKPTREIHLHIERLVVLDGLPIERSQGALLLAAIEAKLNELLAGPEWQNLTGGARAGLFAPPIQFRDTAPAVAGAQIARAIHYTVAQAELLPSDESIPISAGSATQA